MSLLNNQNLPYPDTLHPIIVHFVIAMVFFAYVCDLRGYLTQSGRWLEVSWWNLVTASVSIFFAVIFGQLEAALALAYPAAESALNWHTVNGWSLAALLVALTAWRGVLRRRNPLRVPAVYLGFFSFFLVLVCLQIYLGSLIDWVFGLHSLPVVQATKEGIMP